MRYLSEDWIDAADKAIRDASDSAPTGRLVIDQHVEPVRSYRVTINGHASSVSTLDTSEQPAAADATFRQDWDTAVAVAQGTTDSHQAFLLGQIRFVGDVNVLIEQRAAFEWLAEAIAPLMAATTFE